MGLDIEMKDSGTTSAADQPATPPPVPHITQMGKAKNGATVEADESSPKDEDAEDESSQGQGLLMDLYETLQTELREVRLHLLKLEMESNLREIKLFEEVSALEKLVEEQGLQIYQLEQQNNTLAGMIVDVTQEPGGSSAEVYSDATFEPELLIEPQSDVRGTELVSENTVFGSENILMEVMDSKSQSFQLESFSSEDVVEGRSPNSCDVRSCCEEVTEGKYGDVGVVCNTLLEPVMTKKKEVRLESSPFVEMLGTDNRDVGSESECTGEVLDFMSEEVGDSYLFLSEMRDLENRVVGDVDSTSVGPIVDNKVPGIRSNSCGETAGTTGRGFGWSSTEVVSPKMEASVKVVWTINSSIRPERDVIEFVDEVLNKHEEDICSSNTEGLEEFHGDKENIADPVETDVIADKLNVNYHPAEAERLEKDSQGSETVTETAVVTEKPNLDFHPMTVERLEKERGPHKIKLTLLCSKNLDPRDLKTLVALIEKGVATKEMRLMVRVMRHTMAIRRQITAATLISFLQQSLPAGSEPLSRLVPYLTKEEEKDMDVDASSPAGQSQPPAKQALLPEVEIYTYLLTLIFLIDQKQYEAAKTLSGLAIKRVQNFNRRTLDVLAARLYFYYSYSFELAGCLSQIRSSLLALHRTATLRHDELGQETLLNLLLRNYLHYNLYDQAEKLRSKTQRVESHSNQQLCRYLFYLGRIRTIQLEYTDSKECLLQAARKAPSTARGFRIQCNKWAVIVRLLLGEIPERTTFMQQGMQKALRPYFELTNAVRIGDLELFRSVAERNSATFHADKTQNLIVRLRHNVIRTGLRNISISYSRISLVDVAAKLHLQSATAVADAESIVTKAIRDGGIDATVDHTNGWMQSKETGDIYSSQEPQTAFHSRIAFCLNTHNEAVKALRFPPDAHKKELESAEKRRERQQQEQELAKHIAEEDDDEF